MSLYSLLHKDTIVYDSFKHFISDPRFTALINDYLQSDIDNLNLTNSNETTKINLNRTYLTIKVDPRVRPNTKIIGYPETHMPIAKIDLNKNDIAFVDDRFHDVLYHTLNDLEELFYQ